MRGNDKLTFETAIIIVIATVIIMVIGYLVKYRRHR